MKNLFLIFFGLLISIVCFGQSDSERLLIIEQRLLQIDKNNYEATKLSIEQSLEDFPALIKDYEILKTKSDFSELFTKLTQAANPNNDSLIIGKSYTTFIKEEAEKILTVDLNGEAKKGFLTVLNKITSIPIIGDIINTNPIASMATQVISSASNFLDKKIDGCAFCKKSLQYGNDVKQARIDSFINRIQPYVAYYDKILTADRVFNQQLRIYQEKFDDKNIRVRKDYSILCTNFKIDMTKPKVSQIQKYFNVSNNNYYDVLSDSVIIRGKETAKRFELYESNLQLFNEEFSKLFAIYLQNYLESLETLKEFAEIQNYPTSGIDELKSDIDNFIDKYAKPKTGGIQSLEDPYKVMRIEIIKTSK